MRRIIVRFILVFSCVLLIGCKTTGYYVRLETNSYRYAEISKIEKMFIEKGYKVVYREKRGKVPAPDDVNTFFKKKFSREKIIRGADLNDIKTYFEKVYNEERYWWVFIDLLYVKDMSNNVVRNVRVDIYNQFIGGISPEMKAEIDNIGDLVYQELIDKAGKENVTIERKEWGPPVIY